MRIRSSRAIESNSFASHEYFSHFPRSWPTESKFVVNQCYWLYLLIPCPFPSSVSLSSNHPCFSEYSYLCE